MFRMLPDQSLILASGSPRRKELLKGCGIEFKVIVSDTPEEILIDETPRAMVERLSVAKARAVMEREPDSWVLAADTTVAIGNAIYNKPLDPSDAERILNEIHGRAHVVWGGICLGNLKREILVTQVHETKVELSKLSDQAIRAYVASGEPLDKAGAYAIQGLGVHLVKGVWGSYSNVVGLNIAAVIELLLNHEVIEYVPR